MHSNTRAHLQSLHGQMRRQCVWSNIRHSVINEFAFDKGCMDVLFEHIITHWLTSIMPLTDRQLVAVDISHLRLIGQ